MTTIGKLAIKITADSMELVSGLKKAGQGVDDFDGKATALAGKLKGLLGGAAIAAGGAFALGLVRDVANTADGLGKLSQKTGIAVEDLSRLQYAADLSGVSSDQLSGAITKLSKNMAEAATDTGDAAAAFDAMGVNVKNADGTLKSQSEVIGEVAERFKSYADGAEKSALAQRIFGRSGAEMIPLLNGGAQGLKDMADESDRLGNTLTQETAKAAEQFNDNMTRLETALGGVGRQIAGPLIQSLADLTNGFFAAHMEGATFFGAMEAGMRQLGAAKDIDAAKKRVDELQAEYDALMKSMAHLEPWEQAGMGAMSLAQRLSEAKKQYADLFQLSENFRGKDFVDPRAVGKVETVGKIAAPVVQRGDEKTEKGVSEKDEAAAKLEREREYWAGRVQAAADGLLAEDELLDAKILRDLERLNASALTEQEKMAAKEVLFQEHNTRLFELQAEADQQAIDQEAKRAAEIERIRLANLTNLEKFNAMSYGQQAKTVAESMTQQLMSVNTNSKAMFNIQKAASIGQAVMDTYAGAARALKDYPAPYSYAIAGATVLAGMSRVASIKSQSFGSASAAGGGGGGGGVAAPSGMSQQAAGGGGGAANNQTVTIQGVSAGDLFGGDSVRTLIDRLIDAQRNGAKIVLA